MDIWKSLLLQNKLGSQFINAKTIAEKDKPKKFQVFEVLITETLAIIDPNTEWRSLPVQGDDGVDFIGEVSQVSTPYLINKPNEIVLGQIKRSKTSYTSDKFHYDVIKIIEYYQQNYSQKASLFEIIHVLSTDKNIDASKWLQNAAFPYLAYHIQPVNAIDFLKFWKINPDFLVAELNGIYSTEELKPLLDYINNLKENWEDLVHVTINKDSTACIDDEINVNLSVTTSVNIAIPLIIEWIPEEGNMDIVPIYPVNVLKNDISRHLVYVYGQYKLKIRYKSIKSGIKNMGCLSISSSSGEVFFNYALGTINVHKGIANKFYDLPHRKQLNEFQKIIKNNDSNSYEILALLGQGGIGKTRLAQEMLLYAQNQKYYSISVQNSNDFNNSRHLILDMFIKMLNTQNKNLISYESLYESLRHCMGTNFLTEWNESVLHYILDYEVSEQELENVAKSILTLLIILLNRQAIFIWCSDMHWASKETFLLLQKLLNLIKLNKEYFNHKLIILFEGRDSDSLQIEEKVIFPYPWLIFSNSDQLKKIKLLAWKNEYSLDFIKMLVNPFNKTETSDMQNLRLFLSDHAAGNPMHIKELLRYMADNGNVMIDDDGTLALSNPNLSNLPDSCSLQEIILKRIYYYWTKYPEIIDSYIVLSKISFNLQDIYRFVKKTLERKYSSYHNIEKDIGILSEAHTEKLFLHEYYKTVLMEQYIKNEDCLLGIINYYLENCNMTIDAQLDVVALKLSLDTPDYQAISEDLEAIQQCNVTDYQMMRYYDLLLNLPQKYRKNRRLCEIYFQMSEIAIRISSWKNSQEYLLKILNLKHKDEVEKLHYIMACKSLGNIYGVGLELDKSFSICRQGIKALKDFLHDTEFSSQAMEEEFKRQYEMLLNRIAVTYWFAGQPEQSEPYQKEALEAAEKRQDTYSIAHTLYETGMRQLHQDVERGIDNIQKALNLLPNKQKYTEMQETYLVQSELLIGTLMLYIKNKDEDLLMSIRMKSEQICKKLMVGNANYESTLCHLVNAICYIYDDNYEKALEQFFVGLDCANVGELYTLRWKCYLNIAETYFLIFQETKNSMYMKQAKKYALYGKKLLDTAIGANKKLNSYVQLMMIPQYYFNYILDQNTEYPKGYSQCQPIGMKYRNCCFYIMD